MQRLRGKDMSTTENRTGFRIAGAGRGRGGKLNSGRAS
jgi:hypothetical protein